MQNRYTPCSFQPLSFCEWLWTLHSLFVPRWCPLFLFPCICTTHIDRKALFFSLIFNLLLAFLPHFFQQSEKSQDLFTSLLCTIQIVGNCLKTPTYFSKVRIFMPLLKPLITMHNDMHGKNLTYLFLSCNNTK